MKKLLQKCSAFLLAFILLSTGLFTGTKASETVSAAAKPALNLKTVSIQNGKSTTLKLSGAKGKIRWKSSDNTVASVSAKGKVTAKKPGKATITATHAKKNYKCAVTVADSGTKTLIAYYSWGGTTKKAAERIAAVINADIVRIQPKKTYSRDYDTVVKTARRELNRNARPAAATKITNMSQYDTVLIGYPIWWEDAPMLIRTFLEKHDVSGKTVIPFCTSAGSGISGSMSSIRSSAEDAKVIDGRDLTDDSSAQIREWLDSVTAAADNSPDTEKDTGNQAGSDTSNDSDNSDDVNNSDASDTDNGKPSDSSGASDTDNANPSDSSGKILIAWFSWSGTSEKQAQTAAALTGGDLYRIERQTPYSSDYSTVAYGEAKDEADANARPPLLHPLPSLDAYTKVILCYPIWWHTAPMTVGTFLEAYDWSGKTIYPISQSASMSESQYEQSLAFIKECAKNAVVDNGLFTKNDSAITEYINNTVLYAQPINRP